MHDFTKGEWKYIHSGAMVISVSLSTDSLDKPEICDLPFATPEQERNSNGRLIAEAPVMYELLCRAFDALPKDHPLKYDIDACLCHVEGTPVPGESGDNHDTDA